MSRLCARCCDSVLQSLQNTHCHVLNMILTAFKASWHVSLLDYLHQRVQLAYMVLSTSVPHPVLHIGLAESNA